ncbi:hypothetical protein PHMEG_0007861 [Phytophthora megakarya]|uniref:Reverse transcriptase n=1 Tax=Phytophthora megakarya TaxID=4795 RepID=A0A225WK56_9STRA|nr:hypothetical protein PHMEG_0007861 [Phytophthora megakarya]
MQCLIAATKEVCTPPSQVYPRLPNNLVEQNNVSRWACAVVPVCKPCTKDKFRLTIDYSPITNMTIRIAGGMPSAASLLDAYENFKDKKVFGGMPLHEESREMCSFITPDGVFSPTRVPQGRMDSALYFQNQVQAKLAPLIPQSAITLRTFFEIMQQARFKLNVAKSSLFTLEMLWCGLLISGEGVRHDPTRVDALANLPLPATLADLQYFVCASNWLHESLHGYARMIAPLQDKLNAERNQIADAIRMP